MTLASRGIRVVPQVEGFILNGFQIVVQGEYENQIVVQGE